MADKIIQIDCVDAYNKLYGWETLHPLVTIVNHTEEPPVSMNHSRLNYGLYALFLKQGEGCSIRYGREKYDYQEGTVVSFKPGQVVEVEWTEQRVPSELAQEWPSRDGQRQCQWDESKQYVMDKKLTINQVAYKLGFQYPQHFTRLFKQQVGVTPSEYRN